ncbi:MAG: T9SS type A sorting domain-containing protein [Bacteroidetes bacterium]|nr:MAG: T9SS type A sorting domain-containing protein [Bacteroidota bacterium]
MFNQFNSNYVLSSKTNDANTGTNALKLVCDTGTVQPPLGSGIPKDTIYGSVMLGLVNAQVSNAKVPFSSEPDSLTGYMKGTVINGGLYMNMKLYKAGVNIASATYFFVSSKTSYTRFSVPVTYSQNIAPDTMTFTILATHPGLSISADPSNVFYIDDLTLIYNPNGINDIQNELGLSVYPNPFSTETALQTDKISKDATLTVYNSFGQHVKHIDNLSGQTITLHRDNLPSGLYFIRLTQDNKTFTTHKLVITD